MSGLGTQASKCFKIFKVNFPPSSGDARTRPPQMRAAANHTILAQLQYHADQHVGVVPASKGAGVEPDTSRAIIISPNGHRKVECATSRLCEFKIIGWLYQRNVKRTNDGIDRDWWLGNPWAPFGGIIVATSNLTLKRCLHVAVRIGRRQLQRTERWLSAECGHAVSHKPIGMLVTYANAPFGIAAPDGAAHACNRRRVCRPFLGHNHFNPRSEE
jgi:hypothetical protein